MSKIQKKNCFYKINMIVIGYIAALLTGISLGLVGAGGSILTVPILVYLFEVDPVLATGYSLFIVGVTSIFGSYNYFRKDLISIKTAIVFGIPSIISVFLTRLFILPSIPDEILNIGSFTLTKGIFLMVIFSLLMIFSSFSMIKKENRKESHTRSQDFNYLLIFIEGTIVGILTGLVGAGGGFLIIPALVILSNISMKKAVGTSLLIIGAKSLIGFLGELGHAAIQWELLLSFTIVSIGGIFLGAYFSKFISGEKLKPAFGVGILIMGVYILFKELSF